ncbi:MAG: HipA domain-containing protein [Candidatus Cybelea sp.]
MVIDRPNALIVRLGNHEVGTLVRLPDRSITFTFSQSYLEDENRPTLSWGFFDSFKRVRARRYSSNPRAPGFFANLIAEGHLREYTARRAGLARDDEFGLLWVTGNDLTGAVIIEDPEGRKIPPPAAGGPLDPPDLKDVFRFALPGVQLKFSALNEATCGLTIRTQGDGSDQIVKLPSAHYPLVPEGEYAMLQFARDVGISIPEMRLVSLSQISGLPDEAQGLTGRALVIDRFDRVTPNMRVHGEDFNQIFKQQPEQKYDNHSFADLARVIYQAIGNEALVDFVHRLVFNIGIANNDMHLKNSSLFYPDGRTPQLAPAYDYVCTKAYVGHSESGLALGSARFFQKVTIEEFERLADRAAVSKSVVRAAAVDMVERFRDRWVQIRDAMPLPAITRTIDDQLAQVPLFNGDQHALEAAGEVVASRQEIA